jgi:Uri superfamily endonuclease
MVLTEALGGWPMVRVRGTIDPASLPKTQGCYALLLQLSTPQALVVGRLGVVDLMPGRFVYCGSAQGPGGLRARVGRHLGGGGSRFWHIDGLRAVAALDEVWLWEGARRELECAAAEALATLPGARRPLARFGSSDCRCPGHLVVLPCL